MSTDAESDPIRLCELWGEATPEFQVAHPWSEFRATWKDWIDGLGSLAPTPGGPSIGPFHAQVVSVSPETFTAPSNGTTLPERIVADYFYDDRMVAEVTFVHTGPMDDRVVPQFSIARFDLFPG